MDKYFNNFNIKVGLNGVAGGRFVKAGGRIVKAGRSFISAGLKFELAGRRFIVAGVSIVKAGQGFVNAVRNFVFAVDRFENAVRSFVPDVGRLLLTAFDWNYLTVLNSSLLICLYCGLDAPNNDLTYILTSLAVMQSPFVVL